MWSDGEPQLLNRLFAEGLGCLHLRKKELTIGAAKEFIAAIDSKYHSRIVLHDHYPLTKEFALKGVHLNQRNSHLFAEYESCANSISCHTVDELRNVPTHIKYAFLSPIFDSISKKDYHASFSEYELKLQHRHGVINKSVVALGGVSEHNLYQVAELGFGGAALLGDFWQEWNATHNDDALIEKYRRLQKICNELKQKTVARLHYISNPRIREVERLAEASVEMLRAGAPLVQIRNKEMSEEELTATVTRVLSIARKLDKTVIVNDNPHIALRTAADGVHLGKNDMPVAEARALLGDNFIIGGTANTFDDVARLHAEGADYIGLGPFRFTVTKDNLSPIIGTTGYLDIMERCREEGITTPIIAIGGITQADVDEVMQTGVYGVAMSGGLQAETPQLCQQRINNILKKIDSYER